DKAEVWAGRGDGQVGLDQFDALAAVVQFALPGAEYSGGARPRTKLIQEASEGVRVRRIEANDDYCLTSTDGGIDRKREIHRIAQTPRIRRVRGIIKRHGRTGDVAQLDEFFARIVTAVGEIRWVIVNFADYHGSDLWRRVRATGARAELFDGGRSIDA